MADIFLSYAREDDSRARQLATALEARGWSVFWDRRIPHGKDFNDYIQEQLDTSRCIVVLWSQAALASKFVRDEATEGRDDGRLVPLLFESVKQPLGFRGLHAADLRDWEGQPRHAEFDRLLGAVGAIVSRPLSTSDIQFPSIQPPDPNKLVVDSARYGFGDRWTDVADALRRRIVNNEIYIPKLTNVDLGCDGPKDPYKGQRKRLEVTYSVGVTRQHVTIVEKSPLRLP